MLFLAFFSGDNNYLNIFFVSVDLKSRMRLRSKILFQNVPFGMQCKVLLRNSDNVYPLIHVKGKYKMHPTTDGIDSFCRKKKNKNKNRRMETMKYKCPCFE